MTYEDTQEADFTKEELQEATVPIYPLNHRP